MLDIVNFFKGLWDIIVVLWEMCTAKQGDVNNIAAEGKVTKELMKQPLALVEKVFSDQRNSDIKGEFSIKGSTQQFDFKLQRKQRESVESVVHKAADQLGESVESVVDKVSDQLEENHDWIYHFFNHVRNVPSEEMQVLWGKVLAGEIERPGSTSPRTLRILSDFNQETAQLFRKFCSACVFFNNDARVPSLGKEPGQNELEKYGLSYRVLLQLIEYGLIMANYNTWYDCQAHIGMMFSVPPIGDIQRFIDSSGSITDGSGNILGKIIKRTPVMFQGKYWFLKPIKEKEWVYEEKFLLMGISMTQAGMELSKVVELELMNDFANDFSTFLQSKNLQMIETQSQELQYFIKCPDGSLSAVRVNVNVVEGIS